MIQDFFSCNADFLNVSKKGDDVIRALLLHNNLMVVFKRDKRGERLKVGRASGKSFCGLGELVTLLEKERLANVAFSYRFDLSVKGEKGIKNTTISCLDW